MKVLLTIWISAVLIQEVIPSTLVRLPRYASNQPSLVQTEYEAKYEQKGKHGNESSGVVTGKQEIVHDHCSDDWNAFADKCAALIKDLVASLANAVSSQPGDATNLQLQIKNTFRHFDSTHNCTCFNNSDIDLSPLFNNITVNTIAPTANNHDGNVGQNKDQNQNNCDGNGQSCDGGEGNGFGGGNGENSGVPGVPLKSTLSNNAGGPGVSPEDDDGSDSTNNSRRQVKYPQISRQPGNSPSYYTESPNNVKTSPYPFIVTPQPNVPNLPYANDNSPSGGSGGNGHGSESETPVTNNQQPVPEGYYKPPTVTPTVAVPADNVKPAVTVPIPSQPSSQNLGNRDSLPNAPVTLDAPNSETVAVVPENARPVLTISKPEDDHTAQVQGVPVINSDSNLPESQGPASQGGNAIPLPNAPGPNPSVAVVKEPNSAVPEIPPISTYDGPEQQTTSSVNGSPAVPVADNQQLGGPSNAGNSGTLPAVGVPSSNVENSNPSGENYSENDNGEPSQQSAPASVYPVYIPDTNASSVLPAGQSDGSNSCSQAGPGLGDDKSGNDSSPVLTVVPTSNSGSQDSPCGDSNGEPGGTGNGATPTAVVDPSLAVPDNGGQTGPGYGSPQNNAGLGPYGGQNAKDPALLNTSPTIAPASQVGGGGTPNTGHENGPNQGSGIGPSAGTGNDGTGPVVLPVKPLPVAPQHAAQGPGTPGLVDNGQNGNNPTTALNSVPVISPTSPGVGAGPVGSDTGTPVAAHPVEPIPVVPVVPQNVGQTGQGIGTPGLVDGGQNGNNPAIPSNTVPVMNPISQASGPVMGSGNAPNTGTGPDAVTPVVVHPVEPIPVVPVVPQDAGLTKPGTGSPQSNSGLGGDGGQLPSPQGSGSGPNAGTANDATSPVVVHPVEVPPVVSPAQGIPNAQSNPGLGTDPSQTGSNPSTTVNALPIPSALPSSINEPHLADGEHSGDEDPHLENPTTFQTTSSDPTSPQNILIPTVSTASIPQQPNGVSSVEPSTSSQTKDSHDDDEDDEDCCSCESCTEEEITDPKQYKENACKNLEEARRELKAIFDKIKKKLKCGRKASQTITTTESVNSN